MSSDTTPTNKRYARQMRLADFGHEMQQKLRDASVEVIGDDLAAHVAALYLSGAGLGDLAVASALVRDVAAVNPDVRVHDQIPSANQSRIGVDPRVTVLDDAAAQVASGSLRALAEMKAIFAR